MMTSILCLFNKCEEPESTGREGKEMDKSQEPQLRFVRVHQLII